MPQMQRPDWEYISSLIVEIDERMTKRILANYGITTEGKRVHPNSDRDS